MRVGDRVVVGIAENTLVKASLTAYAAPLVIALIIGSVAQAIAGSDLVTMAAMAGGLLLGLGLARILAHRLSVRGQLAPQYLRRASKNVEVFHPISLKQTAVQEADQGMQRKKNFGEEAEFTQEVNEHSEPKFDAAMRPSAASAKKAEK